MKVGDFECHGAGYVPSTADHLKWLDKVEHNGQPVPLDPANQLFVDFLTVASQTKRHTPPGCNDLLPGLYVCDPHKLVEHCRANGLILAGQGFQFHRSPTQISRLWAGRDTVQEFVCLLMCAEPDNEADNDPKVVPADIYVAEEVASKWGLLEAVPGAPAINCITHGQVERTFVYVDISDFSQGCPIRQNLSITQLGLLAHAGHHWSIASHRQKQARQRLQASLCIGDGYIFVFRSAVDATIYAATLANLIEQCVAYNMTTDIHFRIGVHAGKVGRFWDWGRNDWNYVGKGINDAARVLEAIGKDVDDVVFVSDVVRRQIEAAKLDDVEIGALNENMINRGRRKDKHNHMHRVYELNHTAVRNL